MKKNMKRFMTMSVMATDSSDKKDFLDTCTFKRTPF